MTPERWSRVAELFEALADQPPASRAALLASSCQDDPEARAELARLLEADATAGAFGESPAFYFASHQTPPAPPALEAGTSLGRYEIVELVGAGSMGEVYRGRDPNLGRDVAIKVLSRRGGIADDQLAWFNREARAVAALKHPNIVTIHDVGIDREISYVVSELLDGETLRERLERGPVGIDEAGRIAAQILSGLAAAHERGIVHRDLKPENLFLTDDGVVKILDFGLAKTAGMIESDAVISERGLVMGTAGYMAPEQVSGQAADARSDLFSFGAVLFEMLTRTRAFGGSSPLETMRAVLTATPAGMDSLPAGYHAVVRTCLAKDPVGRFGSAREVLAHLAAIAERRTRHARWLRASVAGLLLVIAAAVASALVVRRQPPGPGVTGRPTLAVLPFEDRSEHPADWLATGLSSMFITALAQTPGFDVISTERLTAGFRELGRLPNDRSAGGEVARRAGAGATLVGTVFSDGPNLRLDVQIQDAKTGRVVVARSRHGADLFGLVDALAADVRDVLGIPNNPSARPLRDVTTTSIDAYALYAKAQQARHNNRWADARTLFEEALRLDPMFTLARAQLVTMLDRLGEGTAAQIQRGIVRTQLNRLPERQRLLAEAVPAYDENPSRAIELLERLLQRYPDEEEAYDAIIHAYSHTRDPAYAQKELAFMERWGQAIPGPGSGHFHNHYGYAYVQRGLFTEAEREFRAYIRVSPDEANAYDSLAELYLMTGRPGSAIENYDKALHLNPLFGWSRFGRAYALAVLGRYEDATAGLTALENLGARGGVPAAVVDMLNALLSARQGRYRETMAHLAAARRSAQERGDIGAEADADLFAAMFAVERDEFARAVRYADRARQATAREPTDIMRARRAALAHLFAGIAEARAGRLDAARSHSAAQQRLNVNQDGYQRSWQEALRGEVALAEGRLDVAEQAFRAAEQRQLLTSFAIYPALVVLGTNLPCRDGVARAARAGGDDQRAAEEYRRLNQPDVMRSWNGVFEPRYARMARALEKPTSAAPGR